MTFATLRALHTVIGEALDEMEQVYKEQSTDGVALDYPSLDIPYYTSLKNSPEVDKSEALRTEPTVFRAANRIVAAAGQLSATVHKPFFTLVEAVQGGNLIGSLGFLEATHLVEILREAGPSGLGVKDIAAKIKEVSRGSIDVDPSKIGHVLRLLATYHWIREVKPDVFANNRLSSIIDSGKPTNQLKLSPETKYDETDGVASYTNMCCDEVVKTHASLSEWLLTGNVATTRSADVWNAPFNLAYKTRSKYYEWFEEPGNEHRLTRFGHAMNGTRYWELAENVIQGFPWNDLPRDSVVVDVGGGIGSLSVILAEAYPHLRFVVEDRAPVVSIAPQSWGHKHVELFSSGRVSFHAQNFFEPQTPLEVPGVGTVAQPAVFLLRAVAHNWPDEDVIEILTHLRRTAGPNTQVFIVDNLLAYACIDDESSVDDSSEGAVRSLVPDGSPLLPNLGHASLNWYNLDLTMMGLFNAKERTYRELDAITKSAGWKITRVKRAVGSLWAYTSASPI